VVQYDSASTNAPAMKKSDLEKHLGKKIEGRMKQHAAPDRYGTASGVPNDRREQREREKAAGLVPFAVKLPETLVATLQAQARDRGVSMNDLAAELLQRALAEPAKPAKAR
jgi:hypothetical protein